MKDDSKPEDLDPHREAEPPQPVDSAIENPSSPADTADEVNEEHLAGAVISELRRGYMLGSRLLRPAMVKVAKA